LEAETEGLRVAYEQLTIELTQAANQLLAQIGSGLSAELKTWASEQARYFQEMANLWSQIEQKIAPIPTVAQVTTTTAVPGPYSSQLSQVYNPQQANFPMPTTTPPSYSSYPYVNQAGNTYAAPPVYGNTAGNPYAAVNYGGNVAAPNYGGNVAAPGAYAAGTNAPFVPPPQTDAALGKKLDNSVNIESTTYSYPAPVGQQPTM